jgi:predicted nucleotidyltransferase
MDIRPDHLEIVKRILAEFAPDSEAFVFGSRAAGPAKPHSDLDLAIKGNKALDKNVLRELRSAFEESDLPYRVDITDLTVTKEEFKRIIEKQAVLLKTMVHDSLPAGEERDS